jgi:hypothetical protein
MARSKFDRWSRRLGTPNRHNGRIPRDSWLEDWEKAKIIAFHDLYPLEGYRRLAYMMLDADIVAVSPSSVYRVLKAAGKLAARAGKPSRKGQGFEQPLRPHEHWHIDVSYINICGRVALGDCSPRAPTDPYVHFRAYGSSRCGFAVPHTTHSLCGDTLGGSMPSAWFRLLVHNAASPSLHGVQEGPFPRFHDTMGRSDFPPSLSVRFVAFADRYHRFARVSLPSVVGVPPGARELSVPVSQPELRWRRLGLSGSLETLMVIVRALRPRQDQAG